MHVFVQRAAMALFALLFSLVAAEGLLRLFRPQEVVVLEPDREIGWRLRRNVDGIWRREAPYERGYSVFRTTELGLRDELLHQDAERAIWVVGDSYVQAANVNEEDTACAILERHLSRETPVEVVNLGVQGYGPIHSAMQLEQRLKSGDLPTPEHVIYCFFTGNDYLDSYRRFASPSRRSAFLDGGQVREVAPNAPSWRRSLILWVGMRSHLVRMIKFTLLAREGWIDERLKKWGLLAGHVDATEVTPEDEEAMVKIAAHYLLRMRDLAAGAGAAFSVVWIDVPETYWRADLLADLNGRLRRTMDKAGIVHRSFAPVSADGSVSYWSRGSGHFNLEGNRRFAERLGELLPPDPTGDDAGES